MNKKSCLCGIGKSYEECCGIYHKNYNAPTCEALMRSRYSAYVLGFVEYIFETTHPKERSATLKQGIELTCKDIKWMNLEVIHLWQGLEKDKVGKVEFKAYFMENGKNGLHHELSRFRRYKGSWTYVDGEVLKA